MSLQETMHRFEVRGTIIREWVVPAKGFVAFYVNRGDVLRFVDFEGK